MTLPRRRPREVYRVYTEDEYLSGAGLELATGGGAWPVGLADAGPPAARPGRRLACERRLRRVAGAAMLAGAVGAVGGVLVTNGPYTHQGAVGRSGSLAAATRSTRIVRSPVVAGSLAASTRAALARRFEVTRSRVALAGGSGPHPPDSNSPARHWPDLPLVRRPARPARSRGGVASVVVAYAPAASAGRATAASVEGSTAAASAGAATARAGSGQQAEFGFER